jgi:YVTN family beta-propeller protein
MSHARPTHARLQLGFILLAGAMVSGPAVHAAASAPLVVEAKIPLGDVTGRIDHLAFDPTRKRLYVAELGNNTVGIVDLAARKVVRTVKGFDEPQGIGYEPTSDTVYVANGGDGAVHLFRAEDFAPAGLIALGDDADNVRVDAHARRVYVGYGSGALAVIDPATRRKIGDIALEGHPESFQLDPAGDLVYVNVPAATQIAVVSRNTSRQIETWPTGSMRDNFPLALDTANARAVSVFRRPARLQAYDLRTGRVVAESGVSPDADDVFVDAARHRLYVICGEGYIDTLDASGGTYEPLPRIRTSGGSRTGLFIPGLDRLVVAIRATHDEPAAVWVLSAGD